MGSTAGWHGWAQVGGTDGYRWAALIGTYHQGSDDQYPDDQCPSLL
ncbi:unnamed protein product [Staurois parvus]|uniref:Uncharacterized protein n=1 Tax=Staurois parvus TaxID=386267 RepID=A0ABN9DPH0_9NEOB|nr:unnamed protein product [Staurois parvus]